MFNLKTKYKLGFLTVLVSLIWLVVFSFPDQKLRLVFCDVGQGDAVLVTKGFKQVLIDGGPNEKVLSCLANNLPFFDRTLEAVILTHPDADHVTGLVSVFDQYQVKAFVAGPVGSESGSYQALVTRVKALEKKAKNRADFRIINIYAGEKLRVGDLVFNSLWPTREWMAAKIFTDQFSLINENQSVLGAKTEHRNLNDFSLVFLLKYQNRSVLLMGDADSRVQNDIMNSNILTEIDILKFPHHGSKTGIREDFLTKIRPKVTVISVGKNSFGHPTEEALDLLEKYSVKIRRTDLEGEIRYKF